MFKSAINPRKHRNEFYYMGDRSINICLARLRMGCSKLNYDLCYKLHVKDDPSCRCGYHSESVAHYFLYCPMFETQRIDLIEAVSGIGPINLTTILTGVHGTTETLKLLMEAVQAYMTRTERFL